MRTHSRRTLIVAGSVAVIGIAVATSFFWSSGGGSLTAKELHFDRQKLGGAADGVSVPSTNVVADFFRSRYSAAQRAEFHVTSSQSIAIFVRATGVQIRTASGWQPFSEEQRNEIWRLKPGIARELFVERPEKEAERHGECTFNMARRCTDRRCGRRSYERPGGFAASPTGQAKLGAVADSAAGMSF